MSKKRIEVKATDYTRRGKRIHRKAFSYLKDTGKAWRTRKAKGPKGICGLCGRPVWARGRKYKDRWYHYDCYVVKVHPKRVVT